MLDAKSTDGQLMEFCDSLFWWCFASFHRCIFDPQTSFSSSSIVEHTNERKNYTRTNIEMPVSDFSKFILETADERTERYSGRDRGRATRCRQLPLIEFYYVFSYLICVLRFTNACGNLHNFRHQSPMLDPICVLCVCECCIDNSWP